MSNAVSFWRYPAVAETPSDLKKPAAITSVYIEEKMAALSLQVREKAAAAKPFVTTREGTKGDVAVNTNYTKRCDSQQPSLNDTFSMPPPRRAEFSVAGPSHLVRRCWAPKKRNATRSRLSDEMIIGIVKIEKPCFDDLSSSDNDLDQTSRQSMTRRQIAVHAAKLRQVRFDRVAGVESSPGVAAAAEPGTDDNRQMKPRLLEDEAEDILLVSDDNEERPVAETPSDLEKPVPTPNDRFSTPPPRLAEFSVADQSHHVRRCWAPKRRNPARSRPSDEKIVGRRGDCGVKIEKPCFDDLSSSDNYYNFDEMTRRQIAVHAAKLRQILVDRVAGVDASAAAAAVEPRADDDHRLKPLCIEEKDGIILVSDDEETPSSSA